MTGRIPARNVQINARDRLKVAPVRQLSQALRAGRCTRADLTVAQIDAVQLLWLRQWMTLKAKGR